MQSKKSATILDGSKIAEQIKAELEQEISESARRPGLAAILIGDDPASDLYIKLKEKAAKEVGIEFHKYLCNRECYPEVSEEELLRMIRFLNSDDAIDAIILQLPLPNDYDSQKLIDAIDPGKDVDGFHPKNGAVIPPTVDAVMELLKSTGEDLSDKKTVIIGKSQVFMTGIEKHLKNLGIKSIESADNIPADCDSYDTIVIALGKPLALKKDVVKNGAIVIDVGINKLDGKTVGDADPEVTQVASHFSPVPGGVGPLTVACLLKNAWLLHKNRNRR